MPLNAQVFVAGSSSFVSLAPHQQGHSELFDISLPSTLDPAQIYELDVALNYDGVTSHERIKLHLEPIRRWGIEAKIHHLRIGS